MRDFKLLCPIPLDEARSPERLYHHFSVERDLAARLKSTSKKERAAAYPMVYEELFRRVPDHPSLTRAANPSVRKAYVMEQAAAMKQWLSPEAVYLEIGAGDAALASEVAKHVRRVYALEVSKTIISRPDLPGNLEPIMVEGVDVPVEPGSVDVAYSNQVVEHLHPEDALDQAVNVWRALKPGGKYVCVTPNRLSGPHDISRYFEKRVAGLHLKEYSFAELSALMRAAGFRSVAACYMTPRGARTVSAQAAHAAERLISLAPAGLRRNGLSRFLCHSTVAEK
ncbi:MAG TPA: class I SAM-dependent methyltransferase [Bryobacteraceae bacterium]|nr:class I SAM-dependent methyltransferase [Bryobacteraceae bacterium]